MSVLTRPAVLLATASLAAGLLVAPGAAYAAGTTTNLTAAEMTAAMKAVAAATTTAGAGGWKSTAALPAAMFGGTATEVTVYDPARGAYSDSLTVRGSLAGQLYVADNRGYFETLSTARQRAAVKMMGRSTVKYVFTADKTVDVDAYAADFGPNSLTAYQQAGSRTTYDDGSVDYLVAEHDVDVTLHVSPTGVLTGAQAVEGTTKVTIGYAYGPQTVTLPATSAIITPAALAGGVAYLDMPTVVQRAAAAGATRTRKAAKGRTVKVVNLRKYVARDVTSANKAVRVTMVKVKNVTGGVRVYATNPWTKKTVAYTVKASGKKVLVKKV